MAGFTTIHTPTIAWATSFVKSTIASSGERIGAVFRIPADNTISKVRYICTATGGTVPTYEARIETFSNGPTGTLWSATTNGTFTPSVGAATVSLTSSATVSQGDTVAVVLQHNSGTIDFSNWAEFAVRHQTSIYGNTCFLYSDDAWSGAAGLPALAPLWAGDDMPNFCMPCDIGSQLTFNNTDSPNEVGNAYTPYTDQTCYGIRAICNLENFPATFDLRVYDDAATPTQLASATMDAAKCIEKDSTAPHNLFFDSISLTAGTRYNFIFTPTSANDCRVYEFSTEMNSQIQDALFGGMGKTTRSGGSGAFSSKSTSATVALAPLVVPA